MSKSSQVPSIGLYQVLEVFSQVINSKKTYFAHVIFKEPDWDNFSLKVSTIRLRGLYNPSSIGPKDSIKQEQLQFYFLHIKEKNIMVDPLDSSKTIYQIIWHASKPSNYEDKVREYSELLGDILLMEHYDSIQMQDLIENSKIEDWELSQIETSIAGDFHSDAQEDDNAVQEDDFERPEN